MINQLLHEIKKPALWLITIIAGLPLLSETVYTPSLPAIADSLGVSDSWVEYTLTIYLIGFTLGVLIWGKLSDKHGRRPYIIGGFLLYALASYGCFCATTITHLMLCRFFQAFGASVGSVVSQAIVRDAFTGKELSKIYAVVGSTLALFPAIGPVIGGCIAQHYGWHSIFLFLVIVGSAVSIFAYFQLPETHHKENRVPVSLRAIGSKLIKDRSVIGYGLLVASCNGILFSYFAEGPFFLIDMLGLSAQTYGFTFIAIAGATMFGGWLSKHLQATHISTDVLQYGIYFMFAGASFFSIIICANLYCSFSSEIIITTTIISMMASGIGSCMVTSNALSAALVNYRYASGAASSLFGFSYYAITSLFTYIMGLLHNGTLVPMPLYFLCIALTMIIVFKKLIPTTT